MNEMRVLMLEAPTALLEERARLGHDRWDEMWDGVLHMVPAPAARHQRIGSRLVAALTPLALAAGLDYLYEPGLFRPGRDDDYKVPDNAIASPDTISDRGIEGAALTVFEIRSPGDESHEKIPWYLEVGVHEVIVIDRDTLEVAVFRTLDPATGNPAPADDTTITSLGVRLERVTDDHLRLHLADESVLDINLD